MAGAAILLAAASNDGGPTAVSTRQLSAHPTVLAAKKQALTVDQANTSSFAIDLGINATGGIAQGFTPTASSISAVDLFLTGSGSNPALSLNVNIRSGTFDGTVLGSTSIAVPANVTGTTSSPTVLQGVFATAIPLTPGNVYYIQVDPDGGFLGAAATTGDAYAGGEAFQGGSEATGVDIGFRTYFGTVKVKKHGH
jgi:hypothetical protein